MKVFWDIFKYSARLPQKKAAFSLNRVGMDMIIIYMFFLLAIASIPSLVDQIGSNHVQTFFFLIFFFIFYYLILVLIVLSSLSVIAYLGGWIARGTKRKLRFSILWKMAACITTLPIIAFTVISFFYPLHFLFLLFAFAFHIIVFIQTILLYPKRRHRIK